MNQDPVTMKLLKQMLREDLEVLGSVLAEICAVLTRLLEMNSATPLNTRNKSMLVNMLKCNCNSSKSHRKEIRLLEILTSSR
jgi:hypothetical protein